MFKNKTRTNNLYRSSTGTTLIDGALVATFPMSAVPRLELNLSTKVCSCPAVTKPCQPVAPAVCVCHAATAVPIITTSTRAPCKGLVFFCTFTYLHFLVSNCILPKYTVQLKPASLLTLLHKLSQHPFTVQSRACLPPPYTLDMHTLDYRIV